VLRELPSTLSDAIREFLRHSSVRLLVALLLSCAASRALTGDFSAWDLVGAALVAGLWPLQEWLIHVYILHYEPVRVFGRTLDFSVPRMHRAHHRDPWRLDLVFIPLQVFLYMPILAVVTLAWALPVGVGLTALSVYFALSLHYEWVHFLVHTRYRPRTRFYERLWLNHRLHHFKNEHYWYGVTMLGGDRLLRTAPERDAVPISPTCRTLGEHQPI